MEPHDPAYKKLFHHRAMVADLVRGYVHEEWVGQIDFDTLERVPDSFVSDDWREREDDVIWRVRWGERWLYLYLLIEFQSSVDRFMAVRLLTYVGLLYQDIVEAERPKPGERLPPVLPIVLYNGAERWWARTRLDQLTEEDLPETLARLQPQLSYVVLDEKRYANHPLPATRNLATALFSLETSPTSEDLMAVLGRLVEWLKDPEQESLRRAFVAWIQRIGLKRYIPKTELYEIHDLQEMHTMLAERIKTWHEQWKQEGMELGMEQGREQGMKQGVVKGVHIGEVRLLRLVLQRRFGADLPKWVEERLDAASVEQLEAWTERALEVKSLQAVFEA